MSAAESRKDELAARALSRLPDPAVPEGLAARIAARATATPQIGTVVPTAPAKPSVAAPAASAARPERRAPRRRIAYAAASIAAALLLSIGVYAGFGSAPDKAPRLARGDDQPKTRTPVITPSPAAPSQLAGAAPAEAPPAPAEKQAAPPKAPAGDAPASTAPTQLAAEEAPAPPPPVPDATGQGEKKELVQTGPKDVPTNRALRPVYGPPAPTGLGIAGSPTGGGTLPDGGSVSRAPGGGAPPSGPPPGMPGPGAPRGSGPRL